MRIILASKSPRRVQLLRDLGMSFDIIPAENEAEPEESLPPEKAVQRIAAAKALDIAGKSGPCDLIIAADTLVYLDGRFLGKPSDKDGAANMLRALSGRTHEVYTGIALIKGGEVIADFERTAVTFNDLSDSDIAWYVSTGEPMDKAGAYGAQGKGAILVDRIDGDFFNVMGLPVSKLIKLIRSTGLSLSDIIKE